MQKGRVLRLRSFGLVEFLQKNFFLLIIFCLFVLGIILGVFIFDNIEALSDYSGNYITDYINDRIAASFGSILLTSLLSSLATLFLIFLLGASLFGVVTVPAAIMLKGFFEGGITAYLYSTFGLKGIAFNAVIYIPSALVFLVVLLVAGRESIKFSIKISSLMINRTPPLNLSIDFKNYSIKFLIFSVLTFVSSFIDASVSAGLMEYFTL